MPKTAKITDDFEEFVLAQNFYSDEMLHQIHLCRMRRRKAGGSGPEYEAATADEAEIHEQAYRDYHAAKAAGLLLHPSSPGIRPNTKPFCQPIDTTKPNANAPELPPIGPQAEAPWMKNATAQAPKTDVPPWNGTPSSPAPAPHVGGPAPAIAAPRKVFTAKRKT